MTEMAEILDLYDIALEGTFGSAYGREACPLCGDRILPDQPIVSTDNGEVCEHHLVDMPEWCLTTEWRYPDPWLARYEVVLATTRIGSVMLVHTGVWQAVTLDGIVFSPYPSKDSAAQAVVNITYPKE